MGKFKYLQKMKWSYKQYYKYIIENSRSLKKNISQKFSK